MMWKTRRSYQAVAAFVIVRACSAVKVRASVWENVVDELEALMASEDVSRFRQWPLVHRFFEWQSTIACTDAQAASELARQFALSSTEERYIRLVQDTLVGKPLECPALSAQFMGRPVTLQSLHEAYVLSRYEKALGSQLSDYDIVVEFGGGSSLFTGRVHETGLWIVYDYPTMNLLQRYSLEQDLLQRKGKRSILHIEHSNINISSALQHCDIPTVVLISDLDVVINLIDHWCQLCAPRPNHCLRAFVATMSLSETSISTRSAVENVIENFDAYLVTYQSLFAVESDQTLFDNEKYFDHSFRRRMELGKTISKYGKIRSHSGVDWFTTSLEPWFTIQQGRPVGSNLNIRILVGKRSLGTSFSVEIPCDDVLSNSEEMIHLYGAVSQITAHVLRVNLPKFRATCSPDSFQRIGVAHQFYNASIPREFLCLFLHINANGLVRPQHVTISDCSALSNSVLSHARDQILLAEEDSNDKVPPISSSSTQERRSTLRLVGL